MRLSVVVPAHDEAQRLATTIPRLLDHLRTLDGDSELIVVDDGSSDGTAELVGRFPRPPLVLVRHPHNRGKGAAVRSGVLASRGHQVLLTDADLSTPIEELERLRAQSGGATVVVGSRAVAGAEVDPRQPLHRELLGKSYNRLLRLLGITALRDTQCGFKLLPGELARRVFRELETEGFAFDAELLWLCERSGAEIREVGVRWRDAPPSSVRIPGEVCRMLAETLRLRRRMWRMGRPGSGP